LDVLVTAPKDIKLPLLPIKSENNYPEMGIMYPKGTWRGIYFSEELRMALKHGYKIIQVFDGYVFQKDNI
jgi:hypothetical protein